MAYASSFCGWGGPSDVHQGFCSQNGGRCMFPGGIGTPLSRLPSANGSEKIKPQTLGCEG